MHPPRSSSRQQNEKALPSLPTNASPYAPQHSSPLNARLSRTSSSPSLHPDTDLKVKPPFHRLNTIPLDPSCMQNKALFGGCVTFYEKTLPDVSSTVHQRKERGAGNFRKVLRTWWLEGVCILVMAACLVAIVLTLRLHEGQPLPAWKQFYGIVNINALLSVYYTIFKGCMLLVVEEVLSQLKWAWFRFPRPLWDLERFNEASRGPKGAIQLLWSLKGRLTASTMPVTGALLVLFALAIDPFTQQIVSYHNCQRPSTTAKASIPRTNNFTTTSWELGASGVGGTGNISMDLGMQGAVFAGAFDSSPVGAGYVPVACPTGNCTFDPYWTLGMCSKVVDMTSQIQYKCRPFDWWNASSASPWSTGAPLCNYSVPVSGAVSTSETLNLFAKLTSLGWGQLNMTFFAGGTIAPNEPYLVSLQLLTWTKPRSGRAFSSSSEQLPDIAQGVGAVNGYIYPCMRRYSGAVSKGVFEERLITTAPMVVDMNSFSGFSDPAGAMSVHVGCLNHHELAIFAEKGYELEGEWSAVKGQDFESVARHIRSECLFSMLGEYASGAQQVFSQVFGFDSSSEFQGISAGGLPDYYRTYPTVQALNDYGNITLQSLSARFEDIARSMTAYMRRMPGDVPANGSQPAYGLAWESDTCVAVSWMWILLPGSLFSLTVLYLFGTLLILSRSRWETMWKSSSLPLLYHGLHDDAPTSLLSCDDLNGMELASKSQSVILHNSGDRWRFQSTGPQIVHTSVK